MQRQVKALSRTSEKFPQSATRRRKFAQKVGTNLSLAEGNGQSPRKLTFAFQLYIHKSQESLFVQTFRSNPIFSGYKRKERKKINFTRNEKLNKVVWIFARGLRRRSIELFSRRK